MYDMLFLYAQVGCMQTQEVLQSKNSWGLAVACLGLLIVFIFRLHMENIRSSIQIDDKLIDMKLITLDDYSIESKIPKKLYEKFLQTEEA